MTSSIADFALSSFLQAIITLAPKYDEIEFFNCWYIEVEL